MSVRTVVNHLIHRRDKMGMAHHLLPIFLLEHRIHRIIIHAMLTIRVVDLRVILVFSRMILVVYQLRPFFNISPAQHGAGC